MSHGIKRTFFYTIILFVCLIAFYFFSMSLVYLIPNETIVHVYVENRDVIYEEGEYYEPFFGSDTARLDGTTDVIMMLESQQRLDPDMGPIKAAMYINGYSRFWHGYQIFLRPALTFMTYRQIRYANSFVFFIAMCLVFASIKKHISTLTAVCFVISLMMAFSFLAPMNMQYMPGYMITFISIIAMLKYKENFRAVYLLFFAAGSAISFFDFLTFPILTLGLPLGVLYFAREKAMKTTVLKRFGEIIKCSFMWGMGYALTWLAKWALATAITGVNVFSNAGGEAMYRMFGNDTWPLDRKLTLWVNFFKFMTTENIIIAIICVAVLLILVILSRKKYKNFLLTAPIIVVALYPYVWYCVFGNHSQYHSFFTYRSQIMSAFIGLAFLANGVDMPRVKDFFSKLFKKKKDKLLAEAENVKDKGAG